ncbi:hypothetical protein PILCRDRAFT_616312 [Piloderma croceum F 1598]|uniref:Uncharacterized protein n=1 Tax=Piloderma croceum (strain F 1598) TaxID=765440 RepID=A0A0C3AU64_PILCF|nr:hypothetical protein PILCRDRAFT_616312 [Piloderma croceum F 1598]
MHKSQNLQYIHHPSLTNNPRLTLNLTPSPNNLFLTVHIRMIILQPTICLCNHWLHSPSRKPSTSTHPLYPTKLSKPLLRCLWFLIPFTAILHPYWPLILITVQNISACQRLQTPRSSTSIAPISATTTCPVRTALYVSVSSALRNLATIVIISQIVSCTRWDEVKTFPKKSLSLIRCLKGFSPGSVGTMYTWIIKSYDVLELSFLPPRVSDSYIFVVALASSATRS